MAQDRAGRLRSGVTDLDVVVWASPAHRFSCYNLSQRARMDFHLGDTTPRLQRDFGKEVQNFSSSDLLA